MQYNIVYVFVCVMNLYLYKEWSFIYCNCMLKVFEFLYSFFFSFFFFSSICNKLLDEPYLDGQNQDAA